MLPGSYALPAAVILAVGGFLACFIGFRLFRLVLGIYGFLIGAFVSTSITGAHDAWTLTTAILIGGITGAILMIAAYFIGVGLVGAGLAALAINVLWRAGGGEPPTVVIVVAAVLGALGALSIARYVVIFGTALAGAWTLLIGALAMAGDNQALRAAETGAIWVFYPLDAGSSRSWVVPAWLGLALLGALIQIASTGKRKKKRSSVGTRKDDR